MNLARVTDGIVVNIESAPDDWSGSQPDDGSLFVPYTDDAPARIGLAYDPESGFEQPIISEPGGPLDEPAV